MEQLVRLWLACLLVFGSAQEEEAFQVHRMLQAAVEAAATAAGGSEATFVTEACLPEKTAVAWRTTFASAVESMLGRTRRTMQKGLSGVAKSVIGLVEGSSCGSLAAFDKFKDQATRLRVLATSHGGLASLDSKVKYEPLKALTVGGIDIHAALNALIVTWQMQKGPEEMGEVLTRFLNHFSDDVEESQATQRSTTSAAPSTSLEDPHGKRTTSYWVIALNQAFERLGDASRQVAEDCLGQNSALSYSKHLDEAFRTMMEKTKRSMQMGLKSLTTETLRLMDDMENVCEGLKLTAGAKRLRSAGSRLSVLAAAKTLMQHGLHVEYEAMRALKVGGIDVHLELNRFIGSWIHGRGPQELGEAMADFFADFKEEEEPEESASLDPANPLSTMLRDAILAAQAGRDEALELSHSCFNATVAAVYTEEMNAAIDHMLRKRKRSMQQGLKELADATDKLLSGEEVQCVWSSGAKIIWLAAKKLRKLTRRTVVDYGTHIQYEAMKSLNVGNIPIHAELNQFIATWKLRSQGESGTTFGELMLKLSKLAGSDEL